MNITQMKHFLHKICPTIDISIQVADKVCGEHRAIVVDNHILIKRLLLKRPKIEQQCSILHELGHIIDQHKNYSKHISDSELEAQLVGMQIALDHKLYRLYKYMRDDISSWCKIYKWNDPRGVVRRYILASRKYLKLREQAIKKLKK